MTVHRELGRKLQEGMSTADIDCLGEEIIRSFGCTPSFLGYNGYPASICVSVNEEVVHGIPDRHRIIKEGDVISLECGVIYRDIIRTLPELISLGDAMREGPKACRGHETKLL